MRSMSSKVANTSAGANSVISNCDLHSKCVCTAEIDDASQCLIVAYTVSCNYIITFMCVCVYVST